MKANDLSKARALTSAAGGRRPGEPNFEPSPGALRDRSWSLAQCPARGTPAHSTYQIAIASSRSQEPGTAQPTTPIERDAPPSPSRVGIGSRGAPKHVRLRPPPELGVGYMLHTE